MQWKSAISFVYARLKRTTFRKFPDSSQSFHLSCTFFAILQTSYLFIKWSLEYWNILKSDWPKGSIMWSNILVISGTVLNMFQEIYFLLFKSFCHFNLNYFERNRLCSQRLQLLEITEILLQFKWAGFYLNCFKMYFIPVMTKLTFHYYMIC